MNEPSRSVRPAQALAYADLEQPDRHQARSWERHRFTPGPRLWWALVAIAPLWLLGSPWALIALLLDGVVLGIAYRESRISRARFPSLRRNAPARLSLGDDNAIVLQLRNHEPTRLRGRIVDDAPEPFLCTPAALSFELAPLEQRELSYNVRVQRRGQYRFGALHMRIEGPLGLGAVIAIQPAAADVRVYPSPRGPQRYELALRRSTLSGVGIRRAGRPGGAGELDQLREYVPGDALRDLAWKASAKRLHPITRVHGQEQSQTVMIALDAGRLMAAPLGELQKLDHAIHAALLLAWVALRAGDAVGVVVFEQEVVSSLLPARGRSQYRRILECVYAVEAGDGQVDFRALTSFVRRMVPRRSLLLLFSDLFDESQVLPLTAELPKLRPKHLPLCVTLRDTATSQLAQAKATRAQQVYLRAAAADLVAERALTKRQLMRAGVQVLETTAQEMSAETVNRYFEIKRQRIL
jgi:uncharacterized protein (DUF58 family)